MGNQWGDIYLCVWTGPLVHGWIPIHFLSILRPFPISHYCTIPAADAAAAAADHQQPP